ncbi:MAG: ISKra4 family transposase [Hyphomicrobiales bacterium]|nr:ISKra4 family transposase [Hyphomicrobiales bacterium]
MVTTTAAVEWKITIEGTDAFGEVRRQEIRIDKSWDRLFDGEIGLSVDDGKKIMAALQPAVVSQEAASYTLFRRICPDCGLLRPVKDYTTRRIRTVFGTVEIRNPPWMLCRSCHPGFALAFAPLQEICPDRATPELTELAARLGSMMPYRQAATIMAEFLPVEATETHATVRKRTIRTGEKLDRQAAEDEGRAASQIKDRRQLELEFPGDRRREFVVSIDTAHVRSADPKSGRNFELVVARCGRGGRGETGGRYFVTAAVDQNALRDRTLHALGQEGYRGFGDVAVISDDAEILKRLPRAMPKPTTHIIDWFHIAMKIQPMQQIADHMARSRPDEPETYPPIARRVRAMKWRLWHGRVNRAIRDLQELLDELRPEGEIEDLSIARLRNLGAQLLTYVVSNRSAIINYGKRYRAGFRVASTLAESAVNSVVGKRMAKSQQMRGSVRGAHMLMQVRTADVNGELRDRLRSDSRQPDPVIHMAFRPKPLLKHAA